MKRRNNKKILIIIIGIILFIIALLVTYIILIVKEILPNPLLDTSDLVCDRIDYFGEVTDGSEYIFKFDKKAKIIGYQVSYYAIYKDYDSANEYYNLNKDNDNIEFVEEENKIKKIYFYSIDDNSLLYGKSKEEVKQIYIENYYYDCN